MSRELKFREWVHGKFHYWGFVNEGSFHGPATPSVTKGIHQQFTGMHDKSGKEIYEGDILKYSDGTDQSHHRIYWDEKQGRWWDERLEDGDSSTVYDDFGFVTECRVIGNIYANPEILKP